jgi:hypothetical protein
MWFSPLSHNGKIFFLKHNLLTFSISDRTIEIRRATVLLANSSGKLLDTADTFWKRFIKIFASRSDKWFRLSKKNQQLYIQLITIYWYFFFILILQSYYIRRVLASSFTSRTVHHYWNNNNNSIKNIQRYYGNVIYG